MMKQIETTLDLISRQPRTWNLLRRIVEADFHGEKTVIARELSPWQDVGQRRFLDFGCGTGEFARCFPPGQYVGIDPAAVYLHYAAASRPGAFSVMDGTRLGLHPASFDAALVLGVFHHLPNELVRAAVAELRRVLKPAATLLVMEDIEPPPGSWNLPGRVMHWLDRGGYIRNDDEYQALFGDAFRLQQTYGMRSGICDYRVYVLERAL